MSDVNPRDSVRCALLGRKNAFPKNPARRLLGVGMVEFLIALLLFSSAMLGLMSSQLVGKRVSFASTQRSIAIGLARDIIERIRANPTQASAYRVERLGDAAFPLPDPTRDCDQVPCTTAQLAQFDLWQWESLLHGGATEAGEILQGGLVEPLACIERDEAALKVTVSWMAAGQGQQALATLCGTDTAPPRVEGAGPVNPALSRRHLALTTYLGEWPDDAVE